MFDYPRRLRVAIDFSEAEDMAKQSHKDECDINNIVSSFQRTGIIQHITDQQPIYTDLPDQMDYQQAMHISMQAQEAFSTLPSAVRRYFQNDPTQLLAALHDPDMHPTLQELGVLAKPDQPQPPGNPVNNAANQVGVNTGAALLRDPPVLPVAPRPDNTPHPAQTPVGSQTQG